MPSNSPDDDDDGIGAHCSHGACSLGRVIHDSEACGLWSPQSSEVFLGLLIQRLEMMR